MAGSKKLNTDNNISIGKKTGHPILDDHTATSTRSALKTAASAVPIAIEPPPEQGEFRSNAKPTGPFNFELLTSQYKIGIIKSGITKTQLEAIKSETDFDYHTLSNLLSVSRTTLIKKKGDEKFDQPTSERIMLLAELLSYGREVFESRERFNTWLKEPSNAMNGKAPIELLDTLYGIEEVKKVLGRIEYGVY
jgi:putative toxin-antitoxin system antitoxin component (TIGR02293 family)